MVAEQKQLTHQSAETCSCFHFQISAGSCSSSGWFPRALISYLSKSSCSQRSNLGSDIKQNPALADAQLRLQTAFVGRQLLFLLLFHFPGKWEGRPPAGGILSSVMFHLIRHDDHLWLFSSTPPKCRHVASWCLCVLSSAGISAPGGGAAPLWGGSWSSDPTSGFPLFGQLAAAADHHEVRLCSAAPAGSACSQRSRMWTV